MIAEIPTLKFKFDPNSLPPAGGNLAFCFAIRVPRLESFNHITQFLRDDSEEKDYALFVNGLVSEAAEIYRITVCWTVAEFCILLLCLRGRRFKSRRVPALNVPAWCDGRFSGGLRQQRKYVKPLRIVLRELPKS